MLRHEHLPLTLRGHREHPAQPVDAAVEEGFVDGEADEQDPEVERAEEQFAQASVQLEKALALRPDDANARRDEISAFLGISEQEQRSQAQ